MKPATEPTEFAQYSTGPQTPIPVVAGAPTPAQAVAKLTGHAMGCECEKCVDLRRGPEWFVHYICCGREWHKPQKFGSWSQADQQRTWYVEEVVEGHDRVAVVNNDAGLFGWPS